jgi:hypothetical protein
VKPNIQKSQNFGSAAGQMDNAHLGIPLSSVNVHGRSGPSQIGMLCCFREMIGLDKHSINEPRNPPHTNKAVPVHVGLAEAGESAGCRLSVATGWQTDLC